ATQREGVLCPGNQLGKTTAGGFELAMHVTGRYPAWFEGKRFGRPITAWACGTTGETTRDTVQRILVGRPDARGTGAIPKLVWASSSPPVGSLTFSIRLR